MTSGDLLDLVCIRCGKAFTRPRFQHDANVRRGRRGPFCSKACGHKPRPRSRMTLAAFWGHVDKSGDCWEWTGARNGSGYGHFRDDRENQVATRWIYAALNGPIAPGLFVLHSCDNPPCVRPDHLRLGTPLDNAEDRDSRGRHRPGGVRPGEHRATYTDDRMGREAAALVDAALRRVG